LRAKIESAKKILSEYSTQIYSVESSENMREKCCLIIKQAQSELDKMEGKK
jgi:hypothetical protein